MRTQSIFQEFPIIGINDWYSISEAYAYWKKNLQNEITVFNFHYRQAPFGHNYIIMCGSQTVFDFLSAYKKSSIPQRRDFWTRICKQQGIYDSKFHRYLYTLSFNDLEIKSAREGDFVFAYEPLMTVKGSVVKCRLLEDLIINSINYESAVCTKAFHISNVTMKPFAEFGTRRCKGFFSPLQASRAALIGGASSTANCLASDMYGATLSGTMSHSWIEFWHDQKTAFKKWAEIYPKDPVFLVDTYDIHTGIHDAIDVAKDFGYSCGIRLDSGDFVKWSRYIKMVAAEAHVHVDVIVSGDMDEHSVQHLESCGATIDKYGIGTKLVDPERVGGVYKMCESMRTYICKFSEDGKESYPGNLVTWRVKNRQISDYPLFDYITPNGDCFIGEGKADDLQVTSDWFKDDKYCSSFQKAKNLCNYSRRTNMLMTLEGRSLDNYQVVVNPIILAHKIILKRIYSGGR